MKHNASLPEFGKTLAASIPGWVNKIEYKGGEMVVHLKATDIQAVFRYLRDHTCTQCKMLADITAVDYPSRERRFELVYNLISLHHNARIRVKCDTDELTPVHSLVPIYSAANWWEREVWEMFGIFFTDHPDLRRLLTDYGFEGHPLRKDFPLTGYVEVRYDDSEKRVVTEGVQLAQEFRFFDFASPWEVAGKTNQS